MNTVAEDHVLLTAHLTAIADRSRELHSVFYGRLFEQHPGTRELFGAFSGPHQFQMLHQILELALDHSTGAASVPDQLVLLGQTHHDYEVRPEMYGWVAQCMLDALAEVTGPDWTAEMEQAWRAQLAAIAQQMTRIST